MNKVIVKKRNSALTLGLGILGIYYCVFSQLFSMEILPGQIESFIPVLCLIPIFFSRSGSINKAMLIWCLPFAVFGLNLVTTFNFGLVRDIVLWLAGFLIIIKANETSSYNGIIRIFFIAGLVYTASLIFEYIFPDIYFSVYYPLFKGEYAERVYRFWIGEHHIATGLSHQVGYTVCYIVVSIGVFVFLYFKKATYAQKILVLGFLILGLMLGKKRMHFATGVLCALIVYILGSKSKHKGRLIIGLFTVSIIILVLVIYISNYIGEGSVIERYKDSIDAENSGDSLSESRDALRLYAFAMWQSNPLWGIGWNQFKFLNPEFDTAVHNVFLQLLCETGIFGFICFILPVLYSLKRTIGLLIKYSQTSEATPTLLFSAFYQLFFFLYFFTGNPLYDYPYLIPYFISVSITSYYDNLYKKDNKSIKQRVKTKIRKTEVVYLQ